jgi:hypothetical protein
VRRSNRSKTGRLEQALRELSAGSEAKFFNSYIFSGHLRRQDGLARTLTEQARIRKLEKERKAKGTISLEAARERTRQLMREISE